MSDTKNKIKEITQKFCVFFEKVGDLTKAQRLLIYGLTFILIGCGYYYFIFMPKHEELKRVKNQYKKQLSTLAAYKKQALKIMKYEKLMAQAQEKFNIAMNALPDKRELPALLTGISNAGSNAGLAFHLFKPDNEINMEFYKQIPVSIKVAGQYHQITDFFYQIIRLNRIVNINNVNLRSKKGGKILEMSCKAVTYMFVEKKEPASQPISQPVSKTASQTILKSVSKTVSQTILKPVLKPVVKNRRTKDVKDNKLNSNKNVAEHYDSHGKIDPFTPLIQETSQETSQEITPVVDTRSKRVLTPLEKIELSQIRLVAVIIMKNKSIAMVEESSGKGYEIGIGTYIGKNHGQVFQIKKSSIIVKELSKDHKGKLKERVQEIKFHKMDEEG